MGVSSSGGDRGKVKQIPRDTWNITAYDQQEGGTHPIAMFSCFSLKFNKHNRF